MSDPEHLLEHRMCHYEGALAYDLALFGYELAEREGYKANKGIEAVRYYLMQKHGWTPAELRAMSREDLWFALSEEMHGWTVPSEAAQWPEWPYEEK